SSPLIAKTEMSNSSTSAAATSSCVESGFDAQSTTSAPPSFSVRIRFAVSLVTWRHAATRYPASGCSRSKRSRMRASPGICRSAHSIRLGPWGASARSLTSCRLVVAISLLRVRFRRPAAARACAAPNRARSTRIPPASRPRPRAARGRGAGAPQRRAHATRRRSGAEAAGANASGSPRAARTGGSRCRSAAGRRVPSAPCSASSAAARPSARPPAQPLRFAWPNLNTYVSGLCRPLAAVAVLEADDVVEIRRRDLQDRRVLDRLDAVDGPGREVEGGAGPDHLAVEDALTGAAELYLRAAGEDVPGLVLELVELEAERLAGRVAARRAGVV